MRPGNYREADPECTLDVIPNKARPSDTEFAISNSFRLRRAQRSRGVPEMALGDRARITMQPRGA
jgi:hypothetical protein